MIQRIPRLQVEPYPRLAHIRSHVRSDFWPFLPLLLEPLTQDEVAQRLGPGYTRRHVEIAVARLVAVLPLPWKSQLFRMALLRVALGMDPCWCEADV